MNPNFLTNATAPFAPPSLAPALKGGDGGALFLQWTKKETENPPPFRVGEMRIFSFRGSGKRNGGGKKMYKEQHIVVYE